MSDTPDQVPQKARLHEVANLMLDIYTTLAEMRYIDPAGIVRGPHDMSHLEETYAELDLDPAVIYLHSILPYIDEEQAGASDFLHGGAFVDFRDSREVQQDRDPVYSDPHGDDFQAHDGPYMRPWYTSLQRLGNHRSIIIYDAREHRIWIFDQESCGSTDPVINENWHEPGVGIQIEGDWRGVLDDIEQEAISDSSDDSSDFWSDKDDMDGAASDLMDEEEDVDMNYESDGESESEESETDLDDPGQNGNRIEGIPSRSAGDVLRDINRWYRELKELPGGGECTDFRLEDDHRLREIYVKHGWPNNFNGDAFDLDYVRAKCAENAHWDAFEPLNQARSCEGRVYCDGVLIRRQLDEINNAKTLDDYWLARVELFKKQQNYLESLAALRYAIEEAERLCPGGQCQRKEDLPLWELGALAKETDYKLRSLTDGHTRPRDGIRVANIKRRRAEKEAKLYSKAFEASLVDAERLCPERTHEDIGHKTRDGQKSWSSFGWNKVSSERFPKDPEKIRMWAEAEGLPKDALKAQAAMEELIQWWIRWP